MRRSQIYLLLILSLSLVVLFNTTVLAQDQKDEEEEEDTIRNMKRSIALFLTQGVDEEVQYIYNTRKLLDFGPLAINIKSFPMGARIEFETPQLPITKIFGFSTVLPNPYIGSPAYEIINTWRNSLNIDVITGKYYWEW